MRDKPSLTAAWVATCRTLGQKLPEAARLVDDPYGASCGPRIGSSPSTRRTSPLPMWPFVMYMQVRTRVIDDAVRAFVASGGRQILILGAGYDCRAARSNDGRRRRARRRGRSSRDASAERGVLGRAGAPIVDVAYLPWDFETRPVAELPRALAEAEHAPDQLTLTIWEGVTMYLSEAAIEGTLEAVYQLSAHGSPLVMNYFDRDRIERPSPLRALVGRFVARHGEPFRFGWRPDALPAWARARGFEVEWDRSVVEFARSMLPPGFSRAMGVTESRLARLRTEKPATRH